MKRGMTMPNFDAILAKLNEIMAVRNGLHDRLAWERYTRTREYMRAYRRQWKLEGPR